MFAQNFAQPAVISPKLAASVTDEEDMDQILIMQLVLQQNQLFLQHMTCAVVVAMVVVEDYISAELDEDEDEATIAQLTESLERLQDSLKAASDTINNADTTAMQQVITNIQQATTTNQQAATTEQQDSTNAAPPQEARKKRKFEGEGEGEARKEQKRESPALSHEELQNVYSSSCCMA